MEKTANSQTGGFVMMNVEGEEFPKDKVCMCVCAQRSKGCGFQ